MRGVNKTTKEDSGYSSDRELSEIVHPEHDDSSEGAGNMDSGDGFAYMATRENLEAAHCSRAALSASTSEAGLS